MKVSLDVKSGINKDLFPFTLSFFHGHTPKSDPAIKPTMIDIVIVLNFLIKVLKMFDKNINPDIDPKVNNSKTFSRYNLSGSSINWKSSEAISINVK